MDWYSQQFVWLDWAIIVIGSAVVTAMTAAVIIIVKHTK